ncbi:MAG: hypothetical protein ACYTF6_02890 [Planctomycetota bacterium]
MRHGRRLSRLLISVILSSLSALALADDVESGMYGGQIVPVDSKQIRMASEEVDVRVIWPTPPEYHSEFQVTANFVLVNDSDEPQSILVSFPGAFNVTGFTRTVDGRPVKVEEHHGAEYGNASKIAFAPRQERRVCVKYTGSSDETTGEGWWCYILRTGARWKGKIGKAVIAVHFPEGMPPGGQGPFDFNAVEMTPANYRTEGRTATWVFQDFEPSENICIKWYWRWALFISDPFRLKSKQEAAALLLKQGQWQGDNHRALQAFAAIREFFPDSAEAKTIDYDIARVLARHHVNGDNGSRFFYSHKVIDAKRAVDYYEAALKGPLDAEQRQDALGELFLLYSVEVPNAAKAQTALDRLGKEKLERHSDDVLLKVGAVSPQKALRVLESMGENEEYSKYSPRWKLKELIAAYPNGLVKSKGRPQPQAPAARPAAENSNATQQAGNSKPL